jgi:hypothetical protein
LGKGVCGPKDYRCENAIKENKKNGNFELERLRFIGLTQIFTNYFFATEFTENSEKFT